MNSSATLGSDAQLVSKESDIIFPATKYPSSRRTPSFSSCSSLSPSSSSFDSSYFPDDSPLNPSIPLRYSGVPFSWEQLPGIPKKQVPKKKEPLSKLNLPLPPPTTSTPKKFNTEDSGDRKKNSRQSTLQRDPFFAALVECSKDDDHEELSNRSSIWNQAKVSRSLSDRFGFINLYASCKRPSAISESIVYLPRSSRHSFDLIYHRSR
ncbi:hypothetical protein I3843_07G157800 [Carya illinoinensis]|uniref:Uncharacterized protein n=1 Tax=Carya illinoinensis TaxID=32201 RepID=A0A8T1Q5I7_CARIL|nr:uncharacterized protein LOC122316367 [Carya illinoinensis]KAG2698607.1 hypothetical protein I3760_07G158300 [Carya illinoinensis]KAG6648632.1 hypothetical protein CIPAW_07G160300 [Carya illinoinensis]KAG6705056.1 hypothetical protein I3842_07G163200 [Carya illinoinensis]KAG7971886.1 hypothetical protein I3843_07G157800 [Carya illinoinensis]